MSGILQTLFLGAAAAVTDAFFNLVTLLLNTTATNGAQNNTFQDSSTNNFSITRNGNTTQGTFTPFSQTGWSNYVGATASYLTVTSQPLINVNDWTVEFWMYPTQYNNNGGIFGASNGGGPVAKLYLYVTGANLIIEGYSGGFFTALSTALPTLNQWTYVSVSRSSSTGNAYLYYNGVQQGSAAAVSAITGITGGFSLFSNGESSSAGFYGYMSNMRVSNVARYTGSNYSVPTAPSTAIANTTLLTAQSNRYVDNSTNGYAIAVTGTPSVQAFSPFLPTAAYSTSVVGGSGYFDGTGDYLTTPSSANLGFGNVFTVEYWIYLTTAPTAANAMYAIDFRGGSTDNYAFGVIASSGNTILYGYVGSGNGEIRGTTPLPLNTWHYCAFVNNGTTMTGYLNGVSQGTYSTSFSQSTTSATIGARYSGTTEYLPGYISGLRVLNGTAATITLPTTPPTAITNTALLLNYTNAGIFDSAAKNVLETLSTAQVSTAQAKWGTTSIAFNGTTDYLKPYYPAPADGTNFSFGTGDFTIEWWMYPTTTPSNGMIMDGRGSGASGDMWLINWVSGVINWYVGGNLITSSAVSANVWTHVAICRSGTSTKMFLNGTQTGSTYTDTKNYTVGNGWPTIGASNNAVDFYAGYLDDIRFTKYARYTANFTAPTAAFPLQ